jgi:4-hydroxy-3-polyprenylbenzoate decarboxylase
MTSSMPAVSLAMTGASGACYGLRLLECLLQAGRMVYLMITTPARVVIGMETELRLPVRPDRIGEMLCERYAAQPGQLRVFGCNEWTAPVASGSSAPQAMVICPCTMGALSAIANGASNNLVERAADVMLKERRRLVVVPRETPVSAIHLENMLRLARLGVTVLPASPGFYHRPAGIEALVDFVVARILDQLEIAHQLLPRWGEADSLDG